MSDRIDFKDLLRDSILRAGIEVLKEMQKKKQNERVKPRRIKREKNK